jgi:serine/alanine adding enzyme
MTGAPTHSETRKAALSPLKVRDWGEDAGKWDRFVGTSTGSTFCHLAGWSRIMTDVFGHECLYRVATDSSGEWRGILPLVRVRSILGHYLISMPFLNDGGPLGDDEAKRSLVEFAVDEARSSGASLVELRARENAPGPVIPQHRKISVHLQLPATTDKLWETTLRTKLRTKIRRAAKEGMVFRVGPDELDGFYEVFARNMRDLGTPVLPRTFFSGIASTFESGVMFGAVYTAENVPVAGACCLVWRDELEVTWGSSLREYNHLSPNMLMYCRLMEEAISRGVRTFNFGRCTPGGGTHNFKLQWGGSDIDLPWPSWSKKQQAGTPSPDSPFYRFATTVWRNLPMAVANRLGPLLAPMLP